MQVGKRRITPDSTVQADKGGGDTEQCDIANEANEMIRTEGSKRHVDA